MFGLNAENIPSGLVKTLLYDALQAVHIDKIRLIHQFFNIFIFVRFKALEPGGICFGYAVDLFSCKNCDANMRQNKKGNGIMNIHRENQQNAHDDHTDHKTDDHNP